MRLRRIPHGQRYSRYYIVTRRQARRARNILCGYKDCICGDTFGARGHSLELLAQTYERDYIVGLYDYAD